MLLEVIILYGIRTIKKVINVQRGQQDADKYGMYMDGNGNYRLLNNKHWVVDSINSSGEKVIKRVLNGETEINIDEIECEKRKLEAIENGNEFYLYRPERNPYCKVGNNLINGDRYSSINNDGIYVIRTINYRSHGNNINNDLKYYSGQFYMDMQYKICVPTEATKAKDMRIYGDKYNDVINFIINKANKQIQYNLNNELHVDVGYKYTINLD